MQPVGLHEGHIEAAANAMKVLAENGGPNDAQVSMMLMVLYMCMQYEMDPGEVFTFMRNNINALAKADQKLPDIVGQMYSVINKNRISVGVSKVIQFPQ